MQIAPSTSEFCIKNMKFRKKQNLEIMNLDWKKLEHLPAKDRCTVLGVPISSKYESYRHTSAVKDEILQMKLLKRLKWKQEH